MSANRHLKFLKEKIIGDPEELGRIRTRHQKYYWNVFKTDPAKVEKKRAAARAYYAKKKGTSQSS